MFDDTTPCCILVLSATEAAALQANLLAALRGSDCGAMEEMMGVDIRKIAKAIGPGGIHDCRPDEKQRESPNASDVVDMILGQPKVPKNDKAADPVDVVQEALNKAGGGKVIPVEFKPKGKED